MNINDSDDSLPLFYRQHGLDVLVCHSDKKEYEELVTAFAARLIGVTKELILEPAESIPTLAEIKSAFHPDDALSPGAIGHRGTTAPRQRADGRVGP